MSALGAEHNPIEDRLQPVRWTGSSVDLLDQTLLPDSYEIVVCRTVDDVAESIQRMRVRGAPAIGVTAAYGFALGAVQTDDERDLAPKLDEAYFRLLQTRPTAVNLKWALERMQSVYSEVSGKSLHEVRTRLAAEAVAIHQESYRADRALSELGADLMAGQRQILTHCNAGPLATAGYGTAVGVIRSLHARDPEVSVLADETRPFLQGARLTAWELMILEIPVTVIADSMAAYMMQRGMVDAVITGADRVVANGDVANKIGTYSLAVLAMAHKIPFFVAAPTSTIDLGTPSGATIPIEERDEAEVTSLRGVQIAPKGVRAHHPAFDVTPNHLITAIITENGIAEPPFSERLAALVG